MRSRWCDRVRQLRDVRTWPVFQLPRWLAAFVVIVIVADVAAIAVAATRTVGRPADLLVFIGLTGCAAVTVEMTRRAGETALFIKDVCGVWELPIAILLPPVYALSAPILRIALTQWRVRKIQPHRRLFTAAAISLSYGTVYLVFHEINRQTILSLSGTEAQAGAWIVVVAGCAALQWTVNHILVFTAVKGSDPTASISQLVLAPESVQNDLIEACVATLVTLAVAISPVALIFALPFVTLLQRSGRHAQLVNDSRIDSKTGLLNAETWRRESSVEVTRAVRTGADLAVALIDIDHFKAVNDRHGHLAGDEVLAAIGKTLLLLVREYDLVGRFGGEEFALTLPQADLTDARQIAERIRSHAADLRVAASSDPEAEPIRLTVSIGLATLSGAGEQLTELLAAADAAMYRAKAAGRNRVSVASELAAAEPG